VRKFLGYRTPSSLPDQFLQIYIRRRRRRLRRRMSCIESRKRQTINLEIEGILPRNR
jgi:hypothetical protein